MTDTRCTHIEISLLVLLVVVNNYVRLSDRVSSVFDEHGCRRLHDWYSLH
jgi:hypothetical protein